ncbi:MAG: hypothetical protein ABIG63_21100 [Chloroflexota bacterium]
MNANPRDLQNFLSKISYARHGDTYEQKYGHYLSNNFPNCEEFWKLFVVPITKRLDSFPDKPLKSIDLRKSISSEIEDIANAHYSMFLNLIFAHVHLETKMLSSLENIYVHLGSVCDLAESVLEKWYLLFLQCRCEQSKVLQGLGKDEFLCKAENWYQENYSKVYQYYLSKGNFYPIRVCSSTDLLTEYLGKASNARKKFKHQAQLIREFRNVIVHNVKVGRIVVEGGPILIPKPNVIQKYKSWREISAILSDKAKVKKDFVEQYYQAEEDIISLEQAINEVWEKLINDFMDEFYSPDKPFLRSLYNIEFIRSTPKVVLASDDKYEPFTGFVQPSGSHSGGTAELHWKEDD